MGMICLKFNNDFDSIDEERLLTWIEEQGYKFDLMSDVEI